MASEYGADNIRVNAILPLLSNTGLFETFVGVPHTPENIKGFVSQVPLGRLTDPEDIANAACEWLAEQHGSPSADSISRAVFLASDEGKFITGGELQTSYFDH